MYLTDYELKYEKRIEEDDPEIDMLYRMDLVHVFQLDDIFYGKDDEVFDENYDLEPFFKELTNKTDELYDSYKDNEQVKTILKEVKENFPFPIGIDDEKSLFFFLFSFENFYLFHHCINDLINKNVISNANYNKLVEKIKK